MLRELSGNQYGLEILFINIGTTKLGVTVIEKWKASSQYIKKISHLTMLFSRCT